MAGAVGAARRRPASSRPATTGCDAVHTPGHAPDHLCFWHAESRTLFCGDLAVKGTTVYIPPNLQGDLAAYLASLERVLRAPAGAAAAGARPGHRRSRTRCCAATSSIAASASEQIVDALRDGDATPDAHRARCSIAGSRRALLPMARESVLAHLLKLEREGRARRRGDAWHIIEP